MEDAGAHGLCLGGVGAGVVKAVPEKIRIPSRQSMPRTAAARTISPAESLAGRKLARSSSFAAARPKYRYASFLYPTMESMVFTAL